MKTTKFLALTLLVPVLLVAMTDGSLRAAERPSKLYQNASQKFWDGEYDQSLKSYRRIVESYPDHDLYWDAQFGMARSYYEMGRMNEAAAIFRRVQKNHPEKNVRGDALFSLVEVAILQDDIIKARNLLRTFLEVYDDHPIRGSARKQLALLEETPTATPAPAATTDADGGGPGSDRPPTLKSPESGQRPDALPTTESPESDTRPVSPPPLRDRGERDPDTPDQSARPDTKPNHSSDTSQNDRISPIPIPGSQTDTATPDESPRQDTGTTTTESTRSDTMDRSKGPSPENMPEPDDETDRMNSSSPERMRERMKKQIQSDRYSAAFRTAKNLLQHDGARPEDYYRAAELSHRLDRPVRTSLDYLNKATALNDRTPGRYLLLKADILLSDQRREKVGSLLATYYSDYYRDAGSSAKARYHFLKGELHRARNQDDEAFFQYMSVLQTASESRWGKRAQATLDRHY